MKIASIQIARGNQDKAALAKQVIRKIEELGETDLVLLPEIWPTGFFCFDNYVNEAESLDGVMVNLFRELSAARKCWLLMGSFVERGENGFFNTSILLNDKGEIASVYRKIHLFGYQSREKEILTRGQELVVAETPWGKVGLATCYDLRFPEMFRKMLDMGALCFLVVSAWPMSRLDGWRLFNQVRAHENLNYLISCNCAGEDNGTTYAGHSMIVDPWGKIIAEAGEGDEVVSGSVDFNYVAEVRREFSAINDRVFT